MKCSIRSSIIEGLQRDLHDIHEEAQVNEGFKLPNNIDPKKFSVLQKNCSDKGYEVSAFNIYRLNAGGKVHKQIIINRKNTNDNLMPQITFSDDKFFVHPSFMGDLSEKEAKTMSDNLDKTCELVSLLNKTKFEDCMIADAPTE